MNSEMPHILCVNPWIRDFAAYDFWAKPMGLLVLGGILRQHGFRVSYIDCLDRFHPRAVKTDPHTRNGRGPYLKMGINKPDGLKDVPRNYSQYGIKREWLLEDLLSIPKPDLILLTSIMTYWYPGVQETARILKGVFPETPVLLGGCYATLCRDHALRYCNVDKVVCGPCEADILRIAGEITGYSVALEIDPENLDTYPYPALDLQRRITYVPIITSRGCPYICAYCASHILNPKRMCRSPNSVIEEIGYWHKAHGVKEFIFYDDALLMDAQQHIIPILEGVIKAKYKVRFHTPNGLHIRGITRRIADLMYRAGFQTIRIGLEMSEFETRNSFDSKVTEKEYIRAVTHLKNAGFISRQVGAYLLVGLPGQGLDSIVSSIEKVKMSGITPILAYYTPIPHTQMWEDSVASSRYDLESDPVFTNNAIFPCWDKTFPGDKILYLKCLINQANGV